MAARTAKASVTKLFPNEILALVTHYNAKRKYYTAKRIGELSGLTVEKATKALVQLTKMELAFESDYKAGGTDRRWALTDAGVEVAVAQ